MSDLEPQSHEPGEQSIVKRLPVGWRKQLYAVGASLGALAGFFAAYLFSREAENDPADDEVPDIPPSVLFGLLLSILALIRQIGETGQKNRKKRR